MHAKALGNCYAVKSGESFSRDFSFLPVHKTAWRAVNRLNQVFAACEEIVVVKQNDYSQGVVNVEVAANCNVFRDAP